jgi:hypothetical protein
MSSIQREVLDIFMTCARDAAFLARLYMRDHDPETSEENRLLLERFVFELTLVEAWCSDSTPNIGVFEDTLLTCVQGWESQGRAWSLEWKPYDAASPDKFTLRGVIYGVSMPERRFLMQEHIKSVKLTLKTVWAVLTKF